MKLTKDEKAKVVLCCKRNLISDWNYDEAEYPNEWFKNLFSFLGNEALKEHLGEAFFQARFAYTLMQTLSLPMGKNKGFVNFQIIQYASICEALLNYTISMFFKKEFEDKYAAKKFVEIKNALSNKTAITYDSKQAVLCTVKTEKAQISWTTNPTKAEFALEKGILTQNTKDRYCALYDLRNNTHILKATEAKYYPKIKEASEAYELTFQFIAEIRAFFESHQHE